MNDSCGTYKIRARAYRKVKLNFVNWYLQGIRYEEIVPYSHSFGDEIRVNLGG